MRDALFLVADKNMEAMIKGFFSRSGFHRALGCGSFLFDARQDLVVAHGLNLETAVSQAHSADFEATKVAKVV